MNKARVNYSLIRIQTVCVLFLEQKNRKMIDKVMDLKDAINKYVNDGEYIGIGGFGGKPDAHCSLS